MGNLIYHILVVQYKIIYCYLHTIHLFFLILEMDLGIIQISNATPIPFKRVIN